MPNNEHSMTSDCTLFQDLVELSQDLHWQCDHEGHYTYLNPAWEKVFGYTLPEMLGRKFTEFQSPKQAALDLETFQDLLKGGSVQELETIHIGKNGQQIFLTFYAKAIFDKDGSIIGTRGTAHNKTDLIRNVTKYRTLFDSNRDAVMILNEKHFIECNHGALEMFGCTSVEEFCKLHPASISAEIQVDGLSSFELANEKIREALETGKAHFEWLSKRYDNHKIFSTEVLLSAMEIDGEKILLATVRDISDRVAYQETLKEEKLFSEKILDSLPGIFYLYTYPQLKLVRWNKNHETSLGFTPEELVGRDITEWHSAERRPGVLQAIELVMTQGLAQIESPLLHKNGRDIPFLMTGVKLETPGQDFLMGIGIDISQRMRIEERLKESEERFSTLFQSMTEMVVLHEVVFDDLGNPVDYKITGCNTAFTRITGISPEMAIGKLASEVYQVSPAPYLKEFSNVAISGEPYEYTTYFKPMDKHFAISVVSPSKNTFATITTDVTDIRHVQDAIIEKNKELENYLYVASHDLRAPLVNLQGFSQKLDSDIRNLSNLIAELDCNSAKKEEISTFYQEEILKSIKYIRSGTARMDGLIAGLLKISRTGRMEMRIEQIDMNKLWEEILNAHHFQISESNATIHLQTLPNCYGDREQLTQLFSNILSNALKYQAPSRPLVVEISGKIEYNQAQYCISDNGVGISEKHQKRVWDVFFRINSQHPMSGDGLGLSIVKRLADKHFGRVWLESEADVGSKFYVELQRKPFAVEIEQENK